MSGAAAAEAVADWLSRALPAAVAAGASISTPFPACADEEAGLARAGPRRLAEFRAGRAAARAALARLGLPGRSILSTPSGAPQWPGEVVGSISHSSDAAVAVVARKTAVMRLGVDIEEDEPLEAELADRVCRPGELSGDPMLAAAGVDEAKLAFVAKEAWYKSVHPTSGETLDFRDIVLRLQPAANAFHIEAPARFGATAGRFGRVGGLLVAIVWTPA